MSVNERSLCAKFFLLKFKNEIEWSFVTEPLGFLEPVFLFKLGKSNTILWSNKIGEDLRECYGDVNQYGNAVFFLDLLEETQVRDLKRKIWKIGGSISHFLNKDVTHIVSKKTSSNTGNKKNKESILPCQSRAAMMLSMALKPSQTKFPDVHDNNLISRALSMGIKIIHPTTFLAEIEAYFLEKDASSKITVKQSKLVGKVFDLKPPFIKVEDHSHQFRPLVREFSKWPSIEDFTKPQPTSGKRHSRKQYYEHCCLF